MSYLFAGRGQTKGFSFRLDHTWFDGINKTSQDLISLPVKPLRIEGKAGSELSWTSPLARDKSGYFLGHQSSLAANDVWVCVYSPFSAHLVRDWRRKYIFTQKSDVYIRFCFIGSDVRYVKIQYFFVNCSFIDMKYHCLSFWVLFTLNSTVCYINIVTFVT